DAGAAAAADGARQPVEPLLVDVDRHHPRAQAGEVADQRLADRAGRAGDEETLPAPERLCEGPPGRHPFGPAQQLLAAEGHAMNRDRSHAGSTAADTQWCGAGAPCGLIPWRLS